jgi:hypothetical protein
MSVLYLAILMVLSDIIQNMADKGASINAPQLIEAIAS